MPIVNLNQRIIAYWLVLSLMFYDNTGYSLLHEWNLWARARTPVYVNAVYIWCTYD